MFSSQTYTGRRNRLKKQVDNGVALFLGNEESPMNYADNTYHFRQHSSFLYFFGLDFAGLAGIVDIDSGEDILFGDELTIDEIVWMGSQPTLAEKAKAAGITNVRPRRELELYINKTIADGRKVHFLPPYRPENKIKIMKMLGIHPDLSSDFASIELIKAVVEQRNYKTEEEIAEIEKACDITADMHIAAMKAIRPGMRECEVSAAVEKVALANNGHVSFPVIATINGQTLHNHNHGNYIKEGDLFLLDAGFETEMRYAGDMSSTIPVSGKFTDRQKEIYKITLDAHEAAISMLKPGTAFKDVHLTACRTIAQGMKELGFMKGDINAAVKAGAHAMFMPCGTGHMMGLDVHDMEDLGEVYVGYDGKQKSTQFGLKSLRLARKLEAGFVLTIEPGIYFIPELIDLWQKEEKFTEYLNYDKINEYRDFGGIRNEEDFLITEDGYRLLGKRKPKTIEEVEALRNE
ncbi:MAG: aminopeptidase P family protein [Bacteroidales bacterium]|nr:aminopeptidase P family protein [Bacteroidales bacterium]